MSQFETDVLVVGGGPAGLAAAIAARRKGLRVVLADGNRPPIDKACGEGLLPDSRAAAARIGVYLPEDCGYPFRGVRFTDGGRGVQADFPQGGIGLGLRRTTLHGLLVAGAERAGVDLRWNTPITGPHSVRARWTVGADGSGSRVRQWGGMEQRVESSRRYAFRQHFSIAPWSTSMEVHWSEGCQLYVTPTGPSEVCAALISRDPHLRLEAALRRHFPGLRERLAGAPPSSRERGAVTGTVRLRRVTAGPFALIGDASGTVDAITGEGICLTFRQAAALADALAAGDLSRYEEQHPRLAAVPRRMAKLMLLLDRDRRLRAGAVAALAAMPFLFRGLLAVHVGHGLRPDRCGRSAEPAPESLKNGPWGRERMSGSPEIRASNAFGRENPRKT